MLLKWIREDKFIKNNIVFFCGSMVVAFLNYLYHPILGRMMRVEDFGEVQAFISFVLIFGVFSGIFKNVITNIVANFQGEEDKKTILMLQKTGLYFALLVSSALLIFGSHFVSFFNFRANYLFIILSILIVLGVVYSTHLAIIQGLKDFKALSVAGIIASGSKVIISVALVFFGWAVFGATAGLILSQLAVLIYILLYGRKNFRLGPGFKTKIDNRIKKELWYAFLFLAASFSVTFLYSADTIIVKKFFSAEMAGFYSGIATIGRIIFFVTGSVAAVLLPSIKINDVENKNKKILIKALILNIMIGGGVLAAFLIFPTLITRILIGSRYLAYVYLLPKISLFLFVISLSNLLFIYLLALRKNFVFYASFIGPVIVLLLSGLRHAALEDIIVNFLIGSLATLILLSIKIIMEFLNKNSYEKINLNSNSGL